LERSRNRNKSREEPDATISHPAKNGGLSRQQSEPSMMSLEESEQERLLRLAISLVKAKEMEVLSIAEQEKRNNEDQVSPYEFEVKPTDTGRRRRYNEELESKSGRKSKGDLDASRRTRNGGLSRRQSEPSLMSSEGGEEECLLRQAISRVRA
jgi:hypothetical protein